MPSAPGITYRQLDFWCRQGHLGTGLQAVTGTGHRRGFSPDEVQVVLRVSRLVKAGMTPEAAGKVARGEQALSALREALEECA